MLNQPTRVFLASPLDDPALVAEILQVDARPFLSGTRLGAAGSEIATSPEGAARLGFHGAVYGWRLEPFSGQGSALILSGPSLPTEGRWRDIRRQAVVEIMESYGASAPETVARRLPQILSRADARVMAAAAGRVSPSGFKRADVTVLDRDHPYSDFFAIEELHLRHRQFDGTQGESLKRAVFLAADAVTVLPYDPVRDRVLLIEQFRPGPWARGDEAPWIFEPIAGRIEPGDTPEKTARKEAAEEAGLTLASLHPVAQFYSSPGAHSEYIHSFVAIADLADDAAGLGGLKAEGEDIKSHLLDRETLMERVRGGEMPDAPLLISAYWLDANLSQLRARNTGSVESAGNPA